MEGKVIAIGGSIIAVVGLVVFWRLRKDAIAVGQAAVDTAQAVGTAVNPVNHSNIFSSTVNSIGGALTGDQNFSFGGWLWDATHSQTTIP